MASEEKKELHERWGIVAALAVGAVIYYLPLPDGLSVAGKNALAAFAALLVLWATEPIPLPIISLLMVGPMVYLNLTSLPKALNNFATPSIFLIGGSLIMATAMSKTGFAERLIYWLMSKIGGTAQRITFGVMLANIVLAFMVPSSSARTAVLLPICMGIIEVFRKGSGQSGRSSFAVGLLLTLAFTNATISAGILTSTIPNPITVEFIAKASGKTISYQEWFVYGFPPALIMTILSWWFIGVVYKPEIKEIPGGQAFVLKRLAEMGKMSADEWKTAIVFLFVVGLWMTGSLTKFDSTLAVLVGVCLLYVLGVINWADANKTVAFQFMLTLGSGFMVADALMSTGAAEWAAKSLFNALDLHTASTLMVLLVVMFIVQYLHIPFMGTTKMTTMVLPIVIAFAAAANVPAMVLAMPAGMLIGGYPLFLFYNTIPNLIVYGTNELAMKDFPRVGFVLATVAVLLYVVCAMTYWRWLGLF